MKLFIGFHWALAGINWFLCYDEAINVNCIADICMEQLTTDIGLCTLSTISNLTLLSFAVILHAHGYVQSLQIITYSFKIFYTKLIFV